MLKINNLSCGYGKEIIIKNINFSAHSGGKICIIGPNGCGKTTLLRALSGLLDYSGEVLLNNIDIKKLSRKKISKSIAMMSQISEVHFSFSVYETVSLGRYAHTGKKLFPENHYSHNDIVFECLKKVGLLDIKDKLITELSGGQLQRVYLARVFAQQPEIILLDEPTNHLDIKHQIELIEYLKEWANDKNKIVISVMHDINLAMQLADKIILMDNGEIVFIGTIDEIKNSDILEKAYNTDIKSFMKKSLSVWE